MLRKVMTVIITLTLFLGIITPIGYGDVKSSVLNKVEAEKIAREKLNLGKDYKLQYSNLNTRDVQQRQFWNLDFEGRENHASVMITADTGEVVYFNQWYNDSYGRAVNLLQDEAKKIAVDFITSLERERFKESEEITVKAPSIIAYDLHRNFLDNENYYFMFVRKVKGEFFPSNYFRVSVSGINGKIISYEMKWDEVSYEGNRELLSENNARDLFENEDRLELKYVRLDKYNKEEGKKAILTPVYVYVPKETDKIDAITGKLLSFKELYDEDYMGIPYGRGVMESKEMMAKDESGNLVEMIPEAGVISREKAESITTNLIGNYVDMDGIKLNSTRYTNYYSGIKGKYWSLYWNDNENGKYLQSIINAENGDVLEIRYSKNDDNYIIEEREIIEDEKAKDEIKDKEKIITEVNEKLEAIFPKTKGGLKLEVNLENKVDKDKLKISSSRYINNITFDENYVNISYNYETKEINNLHYRWYDVEVQNDNSILSEKNVHKIFYDNVGLEKYLVQLKDLEKYEKEGLELPKKELQPVYGIKDFSFSYIDGVTGKFLNYSGEEYIESKINQSQFNDIKGSTYEREILLMNKMGILKLEDKDFKPKEALLRKDALKWIVEIGWSNKAYYLDRYYSKTNEDNDKDYFKDISKNNPYYKYIEAAVEYGIVDEADYFRSDEEITKMELTKWIINAMQQKELAKYSSIFQLPYKDKTSIKEEDIGYVALAKYYNIFEDKNIEVDFEPSKNFNREEFIHFMYYLIKDFKNVNM